MRIGVYRITRSDLPEITRDLVVACNGNSEVPRGTDDGIKYCRILSQPVSKYHRDLAAGKVLQGPWAKRLTLSVYIERNAWNVQRREQRT